MLFDDEDFEDDDMFQNESFEEKASLTTNDEDRFIDAAKAHKIVGHTPIEKQLYELVSGVRPPQAFLFNGAMGVGKATMAFRLARFLLKPKEHTMSMFGEPETPADPFDIDKNDHVFRLVASGAHPDLLCIKRPLDEKTGKLKQAVLVDDLRKIQPFLRLTASVDSGYRIVIIDDADTMTTASQNALLKILEEPPARALIILNTHKLSSIIPTILSRVQVINFPNLSNDEISETLRQHFPHLSQSQMSDIVMMAEGSLGRALSYAKEDSLLMLNSVAEILSHLPRIEWSKVQLLATALGVKESEDQLTVFYERIVQHMRGLIKEKMLMAPNETDIYFTTLNQIETAYRKAIASNLDKKLVIFEIFDALEHLSLQTSLPNAA